MRLISIFIYILILLVSTTAFGYPATNLESKIQLKPIVSNLESKIQLKPTVSDLESNLPACTGEVTDFQWVGMDADLVSTLDDGSPDGSNDGHFLLGLHLPSTVKIRSIAIYGTGPNGLQPGMPIWHSADANDWVLGVFYQGEKLNQHHVPTLGTFSGDVKFDLYASDSGWFKPGNELQVQVELTNCVGGPLQKVTTILSTIENTLTISPQESVLTQHNNNARTGSYLTETRLKPSNVNQSSFGLLYKRSVNGTISAQPLYAKGVLIDSILKNVLYVATRNNTIYAFDVDNNSSDPKSGLIWASEFKDVPPFKAPPGVTVTAVWRDPTHLDLFMTDRDGTVWSNYWEQAPSWQSWFKVNPSFQASPGATVTAVWRDPTHLDLFTTDKDGTVWSNYWEQAPGWQSWFKVNPSFQASPGATVTAVWRDPTHLDLFVTDRDGTVWSNYWEQAPGWQSWFRINPLLGAAPLPGMTDGPHRCLQTYGPVGITSTPVIDPNTNTMYLVFRTGLPPDTDPNRQNKDYRVESHHWLAAIDIRTGKDRQKPVEVEFPEFKPTMELNRPGLLLLNGVIYLGFGLPVCDSGDNPYLTDREKPKGHGWVFAYRAKDLKLLDAFITTEKTALAGIWQSGNGLASDEMGNVYAFTGNNGIGLYSDIDNTNDTWITINDPNHITEHGESLLKLHLGPNEKFVKPAANFTAGNWYALDTGMHFPGDSKRGAGDSDLGSGGPVILPNGWIIGGGKQGVLYVFNSSEMDPTKRTKAKQGFQAFFNTWHPEITSSDYDRSQDNGPNIHGSPIVWHPEGTNYALVYGMPEKDYLRAFKAYDDGHVDEKPAMTTESSGIRSPEGMPGGFLSLSANGGRDGIIWAVFPDKVATNTNGDVKGHLIAFNALTLEKLWEANDIVPFAKFVPPTVADGKVFRVAYKDEVVVYGLRPATMERSSSA
jgi:hypothetical protein